MVVVDEYTYLGTITCGNEADWTTHAKAAVKKAERRSADLLWVCRYDAGIRPRTAMVLWQAMVRPLLEYASEIWAGQVPAYIRADAEMVQLKFIRGVMGLHANGSGVANEVLRAEVGAESIASRWAKLQLGFWRRIFVAPIDRLLRVVAIERHRETCHHNPRLGSKGWMKTAKAALERYDLLEYWSNPHACRGVGKDQWKDMVYQRVDQAFDGVRAKRMAEMPTAAAYSQLKSWAPTSQEYAFSGGEVGRLGQQVPEPYLDDRANLGGMHVKMMCRLGCLPVMDRVGRERDPKWPKASRTCLACDQQALETVEHFVMECPRYAVQRALLMRDIGNRLPPFRSMTDTDKCRIILGRRAGDPRVDNAIDRMAKRRLKKFWNLRAPISRAVNNALKTNDWISGPLFKECG